MSEKTVISMDEYEEGYKEGYKQALDDIGRDFDGIDFTIEISRAFNKVLDRLRPKK